MEGRGSGDLAKQSHKLKKWHSANEHFLVFCVPCVSCVFFIGDDLFWFILFSFIYFYCSLSDINNMASYIAPSLLCTLFVWMGGNRRLYIHFSVVISFALGGGLALMARVSFNVNVWLFLSPLSIVVAFIACATLNKNAVRAIKSVNSNKTKNDQKMLMWAEGGKERSRLKRRGKRDRDTKG